MKNMNNDTMESGGDNGELVLQTVKLVLLALQEAKAITIDWASIGDNGVYARILGTNGTILHEFQGWGRLTYMVDRCLENTRSPELISVIMALPAAYLAYLWARSAVLWLHQKYNGNQE